MVKYKDEALLDKAFAALGDSTRRDIVRRLTGGAAKVTELAAPYDMSLPAISKHIRILEHAGLLSRTRKGREHWCELNMASMNLTMTWLREQRQLWEGLLDNLDAHLHNTVNKTNTSPSRSHEHDTKH